jgi:hypothetical protein
VVSSTAQHRILLRMCFGKSAAMAPGSPLKPTCREVVVARGEARVDRGVHSSFLG